MLRAIGNYKSDVRGEHSFGHILLLSRNTWWGRSWCLMFKIRLGLIDRYKQLVQSGNHSTQRITHILCGIPLQSVRLSVLDPHRIKGDE